MVHRIGQPSPEKFCTIAYNRNDDHLKIFKGFLRKHPMRTHMPQSHTILRNINKHPFKRCINMYLFLLWPLSQNVKQLHSIAHPWTWVIWLVFIANMTQPRVTWEKSLHWGIALIRLACGQVCGELSWLCIDRRGPSPLSESNALSIRWCGVV